MVDPLGVIDEVGADALRFALVNGTAPGMDQRLSPGRLDGARNFANKIWNASRYVLSQRPAELPADAILSLPGADALGPAEHWILARCAATLREVDAAYASFQFAEATRLLHAAIWSEYCDWYLELAKTQLAPGRSAEVRVATWQVLAWVLDRYLRLLHPVMPHITEHIWAALPKAPDDPDLLIVARWPDPAAGDIADAATAGGVRGPAGAHHGHPERPHATRASRPARGWQRRCRARTEALRDALVGLDEAVARLARVRVAIADEPGMLDQVPNAIAVVTDAAEARLAATEGDRERDRARVERELAEAIAASRGGPGAPGRPALHGACAGSRGGWRAAASPGADGPRGPPPGPSGPVRRMRSASARPYGRGTMPRSQPAPMPDRGRSPRH